MQLEELTRAMRAGDAAGVFEPVDVAVIRAKGLRRRRTQRGLAAGAAAASVGAVLAGLSALGGGGVGHAAPRYVDTPQEHPLTSVQRKALNQVKGAYPVDGVVVVPAPVKPDTPIRGFAPVTPPSRVEPLGFNGFTTKGFLNTSATYPKFLQDGLPSDGLVADNGPAWLACPRTSVADCQVSVLVGSPDKGWYLLKRLGDGRFLQPGADMEVFLNRVYLDHEARQSVIGGFDGTAAFRVGLTLADGSTVGATIDSNNVSPGDTLFWGVVDQPVTKVTAYDAAGNVVLEHTVRSCADGMDCAVR
jgi:hypothetical protein